MCSHSVQLATCNQTTRVITVAGFTSHGDQSMSPRPTPESRQHMNRICIVMAYICHRYTGCHAGVIRKARAKGQYSIKTFFSCTPLAGTGYTHEKTAPLTPTGPTQHRQLLDLPLTACGVRIDEIDRYLPSGPAEASEGQHTADGPFFVYCGPQTARTFAARGGPSGLLTPSGSCVSWPVPVGAS